MEHEVSVTEKLSNGALKDKGIHILACIWMFITRTYIVVIAKRRRYVLVDEV